MSICHLESSNCIARHLCCTVHKKGASLTLTSPVTLRHNRFVRECVHGEKVLAQPMTSERRPPKFRSAAPAYATIDSSGIDAIRGLFGPRVAFFVCLPQDKNWVTHGSPPSDIEAD
jgi:hypothetical protein